MKFNEIYIRHGCELKVKPTALKNQVVMLSFGNSQFVTFVDSRSRTYEENVLSSQRVKRILIKNAKKSFHGFQTSSREKLQQQ